MISVETSGNINALISLPKQLTFAAAKTLTQVAKLGQTEGIDEIKSELTVRSEWYLPSRKFGVRIRTATKQRLTSEIYSGADWLAKTAAGETHTPTGGRQSIAVPTAAIQPTGREVIRRPLRPRGSKLKKAFIIETHRGNRLLVKRVGKRVQDLLVLYVLERSAKRPAKNPILKAARRVVEQRFAPLFSQNLVDAVRTAK